jgi:hypothetical protein
MSDVPSYRDLFAQITEDQKAKQKKEEEDLKKRVVAEHQIVSAAILKAHQEGKNWCIVREKQLTRETLDMLKDFCVVRSYEEGVNPSTHDALRVGYKLCW